eukprot:scaffold149930_cov29-Attheya_sp.AAC.3
MTFCHFRTGIESGSGGWLEDYTLHCGDISYSEEGSEAFAEAKAMADYALHPIDWGMPCCCRLCCANK